MKKFILLLIVPFLSFSQIEEGYYVSKHVGFAEFDGEGYEIVGEEAMEAKFYFTTEYFTLSIEGEKYEKEEDERIWYEYLVGLQDDDDFCPGCDVYEAEDGEVELWINYEEQEFWLFGAPNSDDIFKEWMYFENIEKLD